VIGNLIRATTEIIQRFGFWGVFGAGILEQIIVPIPSPMVPMGGGFFLVRKGALSLLVLKDVLLKVAIPFSLGSTLGATMVFLIAYKGASYIVNRYEKFLGFSWQDVENFKNKFFKGKVTDELMIFSLMAIPIIPSVLVSATCGAIQINPVEYYLYTFLGLTVRGIILGTLGWWFGEAYLQMAAGFNKVENYFFMAAGLLVIILLALGYKNRKKFLT
jgi:membrane protein DedA with SNARE-associated domain